MQLFNNDGGHLDSLRNQKIQLCFKSKLKIFLKDVHLSQQDLMKLKVGMEGHLSQFMLKTGSALTEPFSTSICLT